MPTVLLPTGQFLQGEAKPRLACKPFSAKAFATGPNRQSVRCSKKGSGEPRASRRPKSQQPGKQVQKAPHQPSNKSTPGVNMTLTSPMKVQVEAQLANLEQAANPWWSTFCGITNGVWLGQTAAFDPSTGAPEPLALGKHNKPVLDLHTQVTEERVCDGPLDYVTRRTARAEDVAELASVGEQIAGNGADWDEEALDAEEEGLVFFDGGSYSRGPLSLSAPSSSDSSTGTESDKLTFSDTKPPSQDGLHLTMQEAEQYSEEEDEEGIEASPDEGGDRVGGEDVITLEQCLAWGGEQRQRCRLTLLVSGGGDTGEELDVSLLRITLFHEYWQGLLHELDLDTLRANSAVAVMPDASIRALASPAAKASLSSTAEAAAPSNSSAQVLGEPLGSSLAASSQLAEEAQQGTGNGTAGQPSTSGRAAETAGAGKAVLSSGPRMNAKKLSGSWKAFDLTAVPIDETDPATGMTKKAMVYFSQETKQLWSASDAKQQQNTGSEAVDGGAMWLPGNVVLELQMLPMVSRGAVADEVEGMSVSDTGRGLLISFSWLVRSGMIISMQREYDACGDLMEVRSRSAVEGTWVGGRM